MILHRALSNLNLRLKLSSTLDSATFDILYKNQREVRARSTYVITVDAVKKDAITWEWCRKFEEKKLTEEGGCQIICKDNLQLYKKHI